MADSIHVTLRGHTMIVRSMSHPIYIEASQANVEWLVKAVRDVLDHGATEPTKMTISVCNTPRKTFHKPDIGREYENSARQLTPDIYFAKSHHAFVVTKTATVTTTLALPQPPQLYAQVH